MIQIILLIIQTPLQILGKLYQNCNGILYTSNSSAYVFIRTSLLYRYRIHNDGLGDDIIK